jgi:copper(I)-binding protein
MPRAPWTSVLLVGLAASCNETRGAPATEERAEGAAVASSAAAEKATASIRVVQPWVWATPNPRLAAAYFTLQNSGDREVTLLSVSGAVAERVELHESVEQDGVVRMVPHPEGFEVPAGGVLKLERGGKHVMLIGLKAPLAAGSRVGLELSLSDGRRLGVKFPVREATDTAAGN